MGIEVYEDPYHITLVREKLNRNLGNLLPAVVDELGLAVKEYVPAQGNGECFNRLSAVVRP